MPSTFSKKTIRPHARKRRYQGKNGRRGTVLLLALGALGVIALAGLSYVTFVGIDRTGSTTHARVANFQQQVDATTDWMQTVLAADLFGNKVVSSVIQRDDSFGNTNPTLFTWPRRFEDGEARDYPMQDFRTFDRADIGTGIAERRDWARLELMPLGALNTGDAGIRRFDVAPADDAWLAPHEPVWNILDPSGLNADDFEYRSAWSHLTNLRSVYRYVDNADNPDNPTPFDWDDDAYVRLDGRFADLAQFFLQGQTTQGVLLPNGGANLSVVLPGRDAGESHDPLAIPFAPMNLMDSPADPINANPAFTNRDERFMTDTDGDLRADARWQELDALGSLFGYRWVVASRIVDMSGLVNVNTATTAGYGATPNAIQAAGRRLPTGYTPADVDLFRLLRTASFDPFGRYDFSNNSDPNIDLGMNTNLLAVGTGTAAPTFSTHLAEGIGLYDVVRDAGIVAAGSEIFFAEDFNNRYIPQDYRDAHYLLAGASPQRPAIGAARSYPASELFDLVIFRGTNSRAVISRLEERIDGPLDSDGFLPSPEDTNPTTFGPLRSRADETETRRYTPDPFAELPRPSAQELRWNTRNLLTTTSGAAPFSPVPVLNLDAQDPDGRLIYIDADTGSAALRERLNLSSIETIGNAQAIAGPSRSPDAGLFEINLWALAPLAFNEPLSGALIRPERRTNNEDAIRPVSGAALAVAGSPILDPSYHYGGGAEGEAGRLLGPILPSIGIPTGGLGLTNDPQQIGAAYAALTALKLATNTADAFDSDNTPTVVRWLVTNTATGPDASEAAADPTLQFITDASQTGAIELGTRFGVGEIPSDLLPENIVGRHITPADAEVHQFDIVNGTVGFAGSAMEFFDGEGGDNYTDPANGRGLTVVGLERMPFLVEAFSAAAYTNNGAFDSPFNSAEISDGGTNSIEFNNPRDQLGAMLAFKLENPWPEDFNIGASGLYEIWVLHPNTPEGVLETPTTPALKFRLENDMIPAGESRVFAFAYDTTRNGDVIGRQDASADATTFVTGSDPDATSMIIDYASAGRLSVPLTLLTPTANPFNGSAPPVFFQDYIGTGPANTGPTVVLMRNISDLPAPAVVDVLGIPADRADIFPSGLQEDLILVDGLPSDIPAGGGATRALFDTSDVFFDTRQSEGYQASNELRDELSSPDVDVRGRVIVTSNISRANNRNAAGGLPLSMIDFGRSANNSVSRTADSPDDDLIAHVWLDNLLPDNTVVASFDVDAVVMRGVARGENSATRDAISALHRTDTLAADTFGTAVTPWEVSVPNRAPFSAADLALVSKHAHLCYNNRLNRLDSWITVGMQLGVEAGSSFSSNAIVAPNLGVLNLASSLPGFGALNTNTFPNQSPNGTIPDEAMAMPLALRLFDAVTVLSPETDSDLLAGKININTAPTRVLEALPWVAPANNYAGDININFNGTRALAMLAYRDGFDIESPALNGVDLLEGGTRGFFPEALTQLSGALRPDVVGGAIGSNFRRPDLRVSNDFAPNGFGRSGVVDLGQGFASTAELAILDLWGTPATPPTDPSGNVIRDIVSPVGFNAPAAPIAGFASEFAAATPIGNGSIVGATFNGTRRDINSNNIVRDERGVFLPPNQGQAERIALYRALANIVETRSDVYGAWFVLRAYDPDIIESIDLNSTGLNDSLDAMDTDEFSPVYESRWFVLFDRSNVRSPLDKPNILLQLQLPSTTP